jgi:hypothetical protein
VDNELMTQEVLQASELDRFNALEVVPEITFDIKLGKRYDYVDFDYAAYDDYLRAKGLSDEDIEGTTIRFKRSRAIIPYHGIYNRWTKKTTVYIGGKKHGRANRVLTHETQHRVDHVKKIKVYDTYANAVIAGGGVGLLWTGISKTVEGIREDNLTAIDQGRAYWWAGLGVLALHGLINHFTRAERRARQAAKNPPRILRLIK